MTITFFIWLSCPTSVSSFTRWSWPACEEFVFFKHDPDTECPGLVLTLLLSSPRPFIFACLSPIMTNHTGTLCKTLILQPTVCLWVFPLRLPIPQQQPQGGKASRIMILLHSQPLNSVSLWLPLLSSPLCTHLPLFRGGVCHRGVLLESVSEVVAVEGTRGSKTGRGVEVKDPNVGRSGKNTPSCIWGFPVSFNFVVLFHCFYWDSQCSEQNPGSQVL